MGYTGCVTAFTLNTGIIRAVSKAQTSVSTTTLKDTFLPKLEKDLSKEWIKFLASKDEDYVKYILKECAEVQNETPKSIEHHKNLLALRIAKLQAKTEKQIKAVEQEANRYNEIEQIIKQVQEEKVLKQAIKPGTKDNFKDCFRVLTLWCKTKST